MKVILCKAGKPVAQVIAYEPPKQPRQLGLWKGQIHIADDFDELPPELNKCLDHDVNKIIHKA
ncbi:MAG: hypothetical protein WC748_07650 [Legionellales bacterium]|jgi:antitoxin (DNA-binding transcriptional repressor) of toxin-antitoxin stability system